MNINSTALTPDEDSGTLLDKKGAAKLMLVSVRTIDIMMRDRRLPYFKLGKSVRFRRSDIDATLEKFRVV